MTPDEIAGLNPTVVLDDVVGGTYCPEDGWCDTYGATVGFAQAARRLGVTIAEETPVTGIQVANGRVRGVETPRGTVATPLVIVCAGPHTRQVGELAGTELPVDPYRRMSFITEPFARVPADAADDDRVQHRPLLPPREPRLPLRHGEPRRAQLLHQDGR